MDPYAGMIDLQPAADPPSVATDPSTMTSAQRRQDPSTMTSAQRRQRAIDDLPAPCVVIDFDASKLSSSNPPTSFANAAKGTKSQGSAPASAISQLTQLTAENSKLQDEVSSLKQSLQDQDEKFQSVLEATKADHKAAMDAKDSDFRRLEKKLATIEETAEEHKKESEDRHQRALTAALKEARDLHTADSEKKEQLLFDKLKEQFADQFNLLNNRLDAVNNDLQLSNQRNAYLRDELTAKNQEINAMKETVQILMHTTDQPSPSSPNRKKRVDDTSSDMQDSIDASNPARSALSSDPRLKTPTLTDARFTTPTPTDARLKASLATPTATTSTTQASAPNADTASAAIHVSMVVDDVTGVNSVMSTSMGVDSTAASSSSSSRMDQ